MSKSKPQDADLKFGVDGDGEGESIPTLKPAGSEQFPEMADEEGGARRSVLGRFFNGGTLLILMFFALAVGSIYIMRMTQTESKVTSSSADPSEAKIEQALAQLSNPRSAEGSPLNKQNSSSTIDADAFINWFSGDPTQFQVPLGDIKKDPFEMVVASKPVQPAGEAPDPGAGAEAAREKTRKKLEGELAVYRLQSAMRGPRGPIAVINNQIYQVGQHLGNFTITAITAWSVELSAEGLSFTMTIDKK